MEKPGNWFAIAKMFKKIPEEERNFHERTCIFTKISIWDSFSVSAYANLVEFDFIGLFWNVGKGHMGGVSIRTSFSKFLNIGQIWSKVGTQ